MKKIFFYLLTISILFHSCTFDEDSNSLNELDQNLTEALENASNGIGNSYFQFPDSDDYTNIPQDPKNPITYQKVELGKLLYHETAMGVNPKNESAKGTYSCASCHFAKGGFQSCRIQGIGDGGVGFGERGEMRFNDPNYAEADLDVQPIRTPTTLNTAFQSVTLWNGQFGATGLNTGTEYAWTEGSPKTVNFLGFEGVETQAIAGLGVHRLDVSDEMINNMGYKSLFDDAYAEIDEQERYTLENAGLAIATYERTLFANQSPFQSWLNGNTEAMSDSEKRGALLFFTKAECNSCHTGPALNSMTFHAIGMKDLVGGSIFNSNPEDGAHKGRGGFTGIDEDMYKYKTPQLYNLKDSPFYGHGSSFNTLRDIVEYKNNGQSENPNVADSYLSDEFKPLGLTSSEMDDIVAFLENGLYDPNLNRYEPLALPSGNCFPNNDTQSKADLGCE